MLVWYALIVWKMFNDLSPRNFTRESASEFILHPIYLNFLSATLQLFLGHCSTKSLCIKTQRVNKSN